MPKAQTVEETQDLDFLDLMDPEIEYEPAQDSEAPTLEDARRGPALREMGPKLTLIVNESVVQGTYEDHSGDGVDLTIYSRDPDLSASLCETMNEELEEEEAQGLSMPVLPQPRERLDLHLHRQALAGKPVDALQAFFIANMDAHECAEAPELAAVVLKARHDLHFISADGLDADAVEAFREECLLGLLRAAPDANTPGLRSGWRAALKVLGELYD